MEKALVQIIKQSMDKCTVEQFWAVAITIGINSFLISNVKDFIDDKIFLVAILIFSTLLTFYAVFFIFHRSRAHVKHANILYQIIKSSNELTADIKDFFKTSGKFKASDFSGSGFYSAIVLCIYIALILKIYNG